ncbi:MAG: hypothetical protein LUD68_01620 [Rikenellaceae bacterium]|nr:hypothetical protein [Rikenellaceae bacterium]
MKERYAILCATVNSPENIDVVTMLNAQSQVILFFPDNRWCYVCEGVIPTSS